jgi:hypothetical protein
MFIPPSSHPCRRRVGPFLYILSAPNENYPLHNNSCVAVEDSRFWIGSYTTYCTCLLQKGKNEGNTNNICFIVEESSLETDNFTSVTEEDSSLWTGTLFTSVLQ